MSGFEVGRTTNNDKHNVGLSLIVHLCKAFKCAIGFIPLELIFFTLKTSQFSYVAAGSMELHLHSFTVNKRVPMS